MVRFVACCLDRIARDNRLKPESGAQRGTLLDDMPDQLRAHRLLGDTCTFTYGASSTWCSSSYGRGDRYDPERSGFGNRGPLRLDDDPDALRGLSHSHEASHAALPVPGTSRRVEGGDRYDPERLGFGTRLQDDPDALRGLSHSHEASHAALPVPGTSRRVEGGDRYDPERLGFGTRLQDDPDAFMQRWSLTSRRGGDTIHDKIA